MRKRVAGVTVIALMAMALGGTSSAAAFTEVGNNCLGETPIAYRTMVQASVSSSNPLPTSVPSAGIVTKWRVNAISGLEPLEEKLKVFRPTAEPKEFLTVGESTFETVTGGQNVFATRIAVAAGDRFGVSDGGMGLVCLTGNALDTGLGMLNDPALGSTAAFPTSFASARVAVAAIVEPDADGDGYGDETQDGCPGDGAAHGPCPVPSVADPAPPPLSVEALALRAGRGAIRILVATSRDARILAGGQVGWGIKTKKGKRARLIVGLSGGRRDVSPGEIAAFRVKLPKAVLRRLNRLTPKQSLQAKLSAVATDSSGATASDRLVVKLKGLAGRG